MFQSTGILGSASRLGFSNGFARTAIPVALSALLLLGLLFLPVSGAPRRLAEPYTPPGETSAGSVSYDDESCDAWDDENPDVVLDCVLTYAATHESSGTLTLNGRFCDSPTVSAGIAGGTMESLTVLSADETTIVTLLPAAIDAGAVLILVDCPCGVCNFDVTLGRHGPTGPVGPQGPTGSPGATGTTGPTGSTGATGSYGPSGPPAQGGSAGAGGTGGGVPLPQECPAGHFVYAIDEIGIVYCSQPAGGGDGGSGGDGGGGDGGGSADCPCFDASEVLGVGIDYLPQELLNTVCSDFLPSGLRLAGSRGPDPGNEFDDPNVWIATASYIGSSPTNQCYLLDATHSIVNTMTDITNAETQACLNILIASVMFQQNNCPYGSGPPAINVQPLTLEDTLHTGEQSTHIVTITNVGEQTLTWYATITDEDPFASISQGAGDVAPQESYELEVLFDATDLPGTVYHSHLHIQSNDPLNDLVEVSLTLTVITTPAIVVSPDHLEFGSVFVGGTGALELGIFNQGTASLEVTSITSDLPEFTASPTNFLVGPDSVRVVTVLFAPSGEGPFNGTLSITSNDPATPLLTLPLTGSGEGAPVVGVSPDALYVALPAGEQTTETLTVQNLGGGDLSFTVSAIGDFLGVQPTAGLLGEGQSLDLAVGFSSGGLQPGIYAGEIRIASNDPVEPLLVVPATLEVIALPRISVSVSELAFGGIALGLDSSLDFEIENVGDGPLTVSSITSDTAEFSVSPAGTSLPPGAVEMVTVSFTPSAVAPFNGTLSIVSNDAAEPLVTIDLSGQGVDPPEVGVAPSSFSSTLHSGAQETQNLTLSNTGLGELEFSISAVWVNEPISPTGVFVTPSPGRGSVAPGDSLDVELHFTTISLPAGEHEAEIRIASNDPLTPLVTVPATLMVTSAPNLQIPGDLITQESVETFTTIDATTSHLFPVPLPPVGRGSLQLIAQGDYETGSATMIGGGGVLGTVGDTGIPCGTGSGLFSVDGGTLAGLAAGDAVAIDVDNSHDVSLDCEPRLHTVRLSYSPERDSLEFGTVIIGTNADLPLLLVNGGTETLTVSSITGNATEFTVMPSSLTVAAGDAEPVTISFTPQAVGSFAGTLSILSDDPDRPLVEIQLTGEGEPQPPCPCFDESDVQGLGIDFLVQPLLSAQCLDFLPDSLTLDGSRGPDPGNLPTSPNAWRALVTIAGAMSPVHTCALRDNTYGINHDPIEITDGEAQVCLAIILNSEMFALNDCPYGTEPPAVVVAPDSLSQTLYLGEQSEQFLTITNEGEQTLSWSVGIVPPDSFAGVSPTSAIVSPGDSMQVIVQFDANNLAADTHNASLDFTTNDPLHPVVQLPLSLTVLETPLIVLSPTTFDFDEVFVGESAQQFLSISNPGNAQLDVTSITSDLPEFTVTPATLSVAPGATGQASVTFQPSSAAVFNATLSIASDAHEAPVVTAPLIGAGVIPPAIDVSPPSLNVTLPVDGQTTETLTVANVGGDSLNFTVTDTGTFVDVQPAAGTVEAGLSIELDVDFDATGLQSGIHEAEVRIASNDPAVPLVVVPLTLTVLDQLQIVVTPTTLDFGNAFVGSMAQLALTVSNQGSEPLSVTSITSDLPEYTASPDSFGMGPGGSIDVIVTFQPSDAATFDGTLSIASTDPAMPVTTVTVTGAGVFHPAIDVSPTSLHVVVPTGGQTAETLTVGNSGGSPLIVTVIDTGAFLDVQPPVGTVEAGQALDFAAGFDAAGLQPGIHEAEIRVYSNDPDMPLFVVPVTLEVIAVPRISVPVTNLDFGEAIVGTEATLEFEIENVGNGTLEIGAISSDTAEFSAVPADAIVAPGATATVTVTFAPSTVAAFAGILSISSNDAVEPLVTIDLAGQGLAAPEIGVSPLSFSSTLHSGAQEVQNLTLSNTGAGELEFSITAVWVNEPVSPTAVFVTPSPDRGNVAASGSLDVSIFFTTIGLQPGDHEAEIRVASNDPVTPLVTVPATLTVTSAPHIQIPGEMETSVSQRSFTTVGATTSHLFTIALPPVGGGTLQLIADGNFETGSATMIGGGGTLGSVGGTGSPCGTGSGVFLVQRGRLAGLAAGGELAIDVDNSHDVGPDCEPSLHTVRLSYSPESTSFDAGQVPLGDSVELPLNVVNSGTAPLDVSSIISDAAEFSVSPATLLVDPNEAGTVTITFTPAAVGSYTGVLSILSDDPDRPLVEIQLTGEGGSP